MVLLGPVLPRDTCCRATFNLHNDESVGEDSEDGKGPSVGDGDSEGERKYRLDLGRSDNFEKVERANIFGKRLSWEQLLGKHISWIPDDGDLSFSVEFP